MLRKMKILLEHPLVNFAVAAILIGTGLSEGWDSMADDLHNLNLKSHHGVIVLGFVSMLRSLPDVLAGLEKIIQRNLAAE